MIWEVRSRTVCEPLPHVALPNKGGGQLDLSVHRNRMIIGRRTKLDLPADC